MMSVYLVSPSFQSSFANVRINVSLRVNELCNLCWYDPLNFLGRIQSPGEKQSGPHKASELTRKWTCQAQGPQRGGGVVVVHGGYLLHCSLFRHEGTSFPTNSRSQNGLWGHKLELRGLATKNPWLLMSIKWKQGKTIWTSVNAIFFWGGHI